MENFVWVEPYKQGDDLTGNVHKWTRLVGDGMAGKITATGQVLLGVQVSKPKVTTDTVDVLHAGRTPIYHGGAAIAFNQKVSSTAAGLARVAVSGDHVGGIARSGTDGSVNQPMLDILVTLGGAPLP
jgi:hypothetical protein